jgi:hypothetical protein
LGHFFLEKSKYKLYRSKLYFTDLNLAKPIRQEKQITGSGASWSWLIKVGLSIGAGFRGDFMGTSLKTSFRILAMKPHVAASGKTQIGNKQM